MAALDSQILTLSEQLDAMLLGWLERRAAGVSRADADAIATAFATVATAHLDEVASTLT